MNTLEQTREGETHTLNWQVTPEGEFDWFATRELTMGGQPVRIEIEKMVQEFTDGRLTAIHTYYRMFALDNEGNKIDPHGRDERYSKPMHMTSNSRDRKDFAKGFGPMLTPSMWNGYFRSALGYNYTPPFNSQTGQVLTYSEEQLNAAPTGDYYTHHSDGSPINPTPLNDDEAE